MSIARDDAGGVLISVKAVPGAKRNEVVGRLGDRLKVRVAQPPEGGKANQAICELLASELGVRARAAAVVQGMASADKVVRVEGASAAAVESKWPK